jgi:hypothetical protein
MINKYLFIFYLFCVAEVSHGGVRPGSGTVVGNGGDPIFEFFEAARLSMTKSLEIVRYDPNEQNFLCQVEGLSSEQVDFCRQYLLLVLPEMLRLSKGVNKTLFVLREEPLLVKGPDGEPMMVAARTELGPSGPIELHRDSVRTFIPTQALFLIAHEFLHKSAYNGTYVSDNESIGPFDNGRDFLDAVSKYLVKLAVRKGAVGTQFGIRDIFNCEVLTGSGKFGATVSSDRLYLSKDLSSYESSLGKDPTDSSIYVPETNSSKIVLRVLIAEPNNCSKPDSSRKTSLKIFRLTTQSDQSTSLEVLSEIVLPSNPMCTNSSPNFEISWEHVRFSCKYFGSQGTTRSPFSHNP